MELRPRHGDGVGEDGAWSGGYLIVMALISRLETFPQMYAVKLFDMACQTAAALAVLKLALTRGAKPGAAVGAMLACVLARRRCC